MAVYNNLNSSMVPKRVEKPTDNLPQTTKVPLFMVTGKCLVSDIIGEVTQQMPAALVSRVDMVQLSGNSGTGNILCSTVTKLATYHTDLATTASDFVTNWQAAYNAVNVNLSSNAGGQIFFTSSVPGTDFTGVTTFTNVSLTLAGQVIHITPNGTANAIKLVNTTTVGADVDLCAEVNIDTDAPGTFYHITGTLTDVMIATTSGAVESQLIPLIVSDGSIDLNCTASKTGKIKWVLFYIPLELNAKIIKA